MERVRELLNEAKNYSDEALGCANKAAERMHSITVHQHIYSTNTGDINNNKEAEQGTLFEIIEHYKDIIKAKDATIEGLKETIDNILESNAKRE